MCCSFNTKKWIDFSFFAVWQHCYISHPSHRFIKKPRGLCKQQWHLIAILSRDKRENSVCPILWLSHTDSVPSWNVLELISPNDTACARNLKFQLGMGRGCERAAVEGGEEERETKFPLFPKDHLLAIWLLFFHSFSSDKKRKRKENCFSFALLIDLLLSEKSCVRVTGTRLASLIDSCSCRFHGLRGEIRKLSIGS